MKKLILAVLFFLVTVPGWCATYYVKNGGNDLADGLSDANAWATIQKFKDNDAIGDTLYLARGSSWGESIAPLNNTTYIAYGSGNLPIIERFIMIEKNTISATNIQFTSTDVGNAVGIHSSHDIIIDNCIIDGNSRAVGDHPLNVDGDGTSGWSYDIVVKNCTLYNAGSAGHILCNLNIGYYARDIEIVGNTSYSATDNNFQVYNTGGIGINIEYAPYNVIFHENVSYSAGNHGFELGYDSHNCTVERNYIYSNGDCGIISAYSNNNIIKNNILYDNGTQLKSNNTDYSNQWIHNTLVSNGTTVKGMWFRTSTGSGNIFKNNIIVCKDNFEEVILIDSPASIDSDYNLFYSPVIMDFTYWGTQYTTLFQWQSATGQDLHSIASDPLLNSDYTLKSRSPCIDAGVDVGVQRDYANFPRPSGKGWDIGAYEFNQNIVQIQKLQKPTAEKLQLKSIWN